MKDSIVVNREDGSTGEFVGGKDFVEAVAKASSKEELRRILAAGGVDGFSEAELEESYRNLALSQDWNAVKKLFDDRDYVSCRKKLEEHGLAATREEFDLINEVIATATDDALVAELTRTRDVESSLEVLHRHGYYKMTEDFLLLVRENVLHLREDALLTPEELKEFSGNSFFERCKKSINLIFALSSIAGLALGVSSVADPALLIAIAGGVSLVLGIDHVDEGRK